MKEKSNRINQTISNLMQNLTDIVDINTVVGSPIENENNVIIPVAKVTLCLITGGGEYGKISIFNKGEDLPFSAGNGSVISIKPCAFLVKNKSELDYKVLSVSSNKYDGVIDKASDLIKNLTDTIFKETKSEKDL